MHSKVALKLRALVVALALASSVAVAPPAARPASAVDCSYYTCGTIIVSLSGAGNAYISDDQSELSCSYSNGSPGQCAGSYYWIGASTTVTVTVAPGADSYVCSPCKDPGVAYSQTLTLTGGTVTLLETVNRAKSLVINASVSGDGTGTITSTPSGISCHLASGVVSGACAHTWYFRDSMSVTLHLDPAPGSKACTINSAGTFCDPVGQTKTDGVGTAYSQTFNWSYSFTLAHPIVSVGVTGAGNVVSSPTGINCGATCASYFAPGSNLTLTAAAKAGSHFDHWSGACADYGPTCNLSLGTSDVSTTAVFASNTTPPPSTGPTPGPTITPAPRGTPGATRTPAPGATPAPTQFRGPTSAPATSVPGNANATIAPPASGEPAPSGGAESEVSPVAPDSATMSTDAGAASSAGGGVQPVSGDAPGSIDPLVFVVVVMGGVIVLLIGLVVGLGAGRARGTKST